jgi:hypothetical protein
VVIVDPDTVARPGNFHNLVTEDVIYLLVCFPISVFIDRIQIEIVKKRPDGLVAKAVIEILHIGPGQKDRMTAFLKQLGPDFLPFLARDSVRSNARPAYPLAVV